MSKGPGLVAAVLLLGLVLPGSALAATRTALNRCNDAVQILRSNPSMAFKDRDVDPLNVENALMHRRQVIDGYNRASAKINQIPKNELDVKDPELSECVAMVTKWAAYIKELDAKIKVAEEQGATLGPFLEEVKAYERGFFQMMSVVFNPAADPLTNMKKEDARKVLDDLAIVEKACAARLPQAGAAPPPQAKVGAGQVQHVGSVSMPASLAKSGDAWCYVAKHRVELMTRAIGNKGFHAEGYGNYSILVPEAIKSLESGGGYMEAWIADIVVSPAKFKAALLDEAKAWYTALGLPMPAAPLAAIDAMVDNLITNVDAAAPNAKPFPGGPHAAAIEKGAKKALLTIYPKAKVLKTVMDTDDFTISKNGVGIPTDRYRSGQIMFRLPGAKWCSQRTFSYVETYTGAGKFAKPKKVSVLGATRFLACK